MRNRMTDKALADSQSDFFLANVVEWSVKEDMASMELPLFALTRNKDISIREYERGGIKCRISPSADGAATQHDKDLLIFAASQLLAARKEGKPVSRTVMINAYDFLMGTRRDTGGKNYCDLVPMLRRLKGTAIETNVKTGGKEQTKGFGLIDDYEITRYTNGKNEGALEFTITLSEWLTNALEHYEVLTLSPDYFSIRGPIERRLYELARKHCGEQAIWKINEELLREKVGSRRDTRQFRVELREVMSADSMPSYRLAIDSSTRPHIIVFYTRNEPRLFKALAQEHAHQWFHNLERFRVESKKSNSLPKQESLPLEKK